MRKVFVGGLPDTRTSYKLKEYFQGIDPNVQEARVMTDPVNEKSRYT